MWQTDYLFQTYHFLEKSYNQAYDFIDLAGSMVYLFIRKIPKSLGYFGIFDLFFVGPRIIRSFKPLFTKSTFEELIFIPLNAVSEVNGALLQFAFAQELIKSANTALIHRIYNVLYPVDLILTGRTIYDLYQANSLRERLVAICKDGTLEEARCFIEKNRNTLERSLTFPKNFTRVMDIKQVDELCSYLKKRMIFAVMNQVVQCATSVFAITCYIPAVSPFFLLGYSISGIAQAVLRITEKVVVKKNHIIFNSRHLYMTKG